MNGHDIIVIGASAGGVEALTTIAAGLPADFPASVLVVIHCSPATPGRMPGLLSRAGPLPARHAEDGEELLPGRIYVGPPGRHLLVRSGHVHLSRGPKENNTRPAVNPLFRTAAAAYGGRVVGVVLTGNLDDGTAGLLGISEAGGVTVVQDPNEAAHPGMPGYALETLDVDHVLPLHEIAPLLDRLARTPPRAAPPVAAPVSDYLDEGARSQWLGSYAVPGQAAGLSCPECNGPLWEIREGEMIQFGCMIGHVYSPETLLDATETQIEEALGMSLRAMEERAALATRLAEWVRERGRDPDRAVRHAREADNALARARRLRAEMEGAMLAPSAGDD